MAGTDGSQHIPTGVPLHHGIARKVPAFLGLGLVKAFQPHPGLLQELEPRWSEAIAAASGAVHPGHFGRPEFPPNAANK